MSARHFYRVVGGTTLIEQTLIPREGWEVKSAAEEGTTPMVTLTIPDPDLTLDYVGHRRWMIVEDESEDTDDVLYDGYVADQEIGRIGGEFEEPLGRVWVVSLTDANTVWQRRVMTGTDCKRPAETDVARMQWLLATNEATPWFDNVTDFVFTANPVDMDKVDYRGQMFNQIADDCAQASGKNWYVFYRNNGSARELCAWYGSDDTDVYSSDLALSNDTADFDDAAMIAGTATVWPISYDTKLTRSPDRVYDGVYESYDGGAVYRKRAATGIAFDHRDFVAPSLNVKTKTKAIARAVRWLANMDEQDERITTTVELPKAKGTKIKAGMLISFKATYLPGYEDFRACRVFSVAPSLVAAGSRYRLALELGPVTVTARPLSFTVTADTIVGGSSRGVNTVLQRSQLVVGTTYTVAFTYTNSSIGSYGQQIGFRNGPDVTVDTLVGQGGPAVHIDGIPYAEDGSGGSPDGDWAFALAPLSTGSGAAMTAGGTWTYDAGTEAYWLTHWPDTLYFSIEGAHSPSTPVVPGESGTLTLTPL